MFTDYLGAPMLWNDAGNSFGAQAGWVCRLDNWTEMSGWMCERKNAMGLVQIGLEARTED